MKKSTAAVIMFVCAVIVLIGGIIDDNIWAYVAAASLVLGGAGIAISGRSSGDDA